MTNPLAIRDSLQTNFYRHPALLPTMSWLDSIPPLPPRDLKAASTPEGIELFWHESGEALDGDGAASYVIYRFEARRPKLIVDEQLLIVARCIGESCTRFMDKTADPKKKYTYVVTALDRLHNESRQAIVKVQ